MCNIHLLATDRCQANVIKLHCSSGTSFLRGSTVGVDLDVTYIIDFANLIMIQVGKTGKIHYAISDYTCKEKCDGGIVYEFEATREQHKFSVELHWNQYDVVYIVKHYATPHCCVKDEYDMGTYCEFADQVQVDGYNLIL